MTRPVLLDNIFTPQAINKFTLFKQILILSVRKGVANRQPSVFPQLYCILLGQLALLCATQFPCIFNCCVV